MEKGMSRREIGEGAYFTHIRDPKFKHNRITVNLILPLARETASEYALLPFLLRLGCKSCPDLTALNARLCELYGASLEGGVTKYNGYQILGISIRGIDNRFALSGEDIASELAKLLCDVVMEPKLRENGLFYEEDLALERQFLIDTIEAEINDKRTYALLQCVAAMCGDEPVAVRRYGYIEDAEAITPVSATAAWRRALETARIEIMFTGSGSPDSAVQLFQERLSGIKRTPHACEMIALRDRADNVRELTEEMPLHQSKLVLGLRCAGIKTPENVAAARIFSAMLGGTPFSKLFLNVRERLSLCYYCAAHYDVSNRLLFVDSGVERGNKETAQEEILRQLKAIQESDFTTEELSNTKLLMKNSILSVTDSLASLETWYLTRALRGLCSTPEEDCATVDAIPAGEVVRIARGVTLDTVYFLTGKGAQ